MTLLFRGKPMKPKPKPHPCQPPRRSFAGLTEHPWAVEADPSVGFGALWQCDDCDRYWQTRGIAGGGGPWWFPISDRKARRLIRRRSRSEHVPLPDSIPLIRPERSDPT